jgi:hypothetical protein
MQQYFRSPSETESHRQTMRHVSTPDSMGFAGGIGLSSGRVAEAHRRGESEYPTANSIEMKIWAVLFALVILATITLIVIIVMEEPARVHATLFYRSWIASSPVFFFS